MPLCEVLYAPRSKPEDVFPGSAKIVWWLCRKNASHEWPASISQRHRLGSGCPFCASKTSQLELMVFSEMKYIFDDVFHRIKLGGHEVDVYIPELKTGIEVDGLYWHKNRHEKDSIKNEMLSRMGIYIIRLREKGLNKITDADIVVNATDKPIDIIQCILCSMKQNIEMPARQSAMANKYLKRNTLANDKYYREILDMLPSPLPELSLAMLNKQLAKEWHPTRNGNLTPKDVSMGSNKVVWWICKKNKEHEWEASVHQRAAGGKRKGSGCPYCSNQRVCKDNCLATVNPSLAQEWHPEKNGNLTPEGVTPGSDKKAWWLCSVNEEHEWPARIANRSKGVGCPYCSGRKVRKDGYQPNIKKVEIDGE